MLSQEDFRVIKARTKRGVYQKDIAAELGVHPKTISRALKRGSAPIRHRRTRPSKLDPFKATIDRLLQEGVWNAVVIFREIQALGYAGQLTMLRAYIRPKRALRPSRATVRFETPPGQQLQSDWGEIVTEIAGQPTKVQFIVNTLAYSRRFHAWATTSVDAEHTYAGIIRSLEYFGGVPQEVLVDNQKAAVLQHLPGGIVTFHPRFRDLADHYGFTPRACRPYRARTKGKDERMVGYLKQHFFVRYRTFASWTHLNQLLEQWLREEADQRVHGTVHEVVVERFAREAPTLQPLPSQPYDPSYQETRRVAWDSYLDVRGNRYSVPATLVGQVVRVRISLDDELRIYAGDQLVATHRLQTVQQGWVTVPDHHASLWQAALQVEQRPLAVYEEVAQWSL
jgi:transposase